MSFLFVDSIQSLSIQKPVLGECYIPPNSPYLVANSAGVLTFIPSLIAEAVGQLGAWAVMKETGFKKRPVAGVVSSVSILGDAKPGDRLKLKTTIDELLDDQIQYHGEALVDDKVVLRIEKAIGPFLPMSDFIHEAVVKAQCDAIGSTSIIPYGDISQPKSADKKITDFDRFLTFEKGKPVVAEKTLDGRSPFLSDHFPLKPVLPLSLLIHAKLTLAIQYMQEFSPFAYKRVEVKKVKMGQFVEPGDTVSTEMILKTETEAERVFVFRSFSKGKRAAVCEAHFLKS